jgi:hypothetical protein
MKREFNFYYILAPLILLVWAGFIYFVLNAAFQPILEIGDQIKVKASTNTVLLEMIETETENIYLYDDLSQTIHVYDNSGNYGTSYDFTFSGSIEIIDIDEDEEIFTVYFNRINKFYRIDFSGEVLDIAADNDGIAIEPLNMVRSNNGITIKNYFIFYDIYISPENQFRIYSFLPVVILGGVIFLIGMLYSVKQVKSRQGHD